MAPKQTPPFRAEHVGSLLRPDYLFQARKKFDSKEITREQLQEVENQAIAEAMNIQREAGIRSFTDGEYRRHIFCEGFFENLQGIEEVHDAPLEIFKSYVPSARVYTTMSHKVSTFLCTDKIRHVKSGYVPEFEAVKKLVHPDEVKNIKMTVVTPEWFHLLHGEHAYKPGVYANSEEYFADIVAAYRQELDALYTAGCRNIQIDDPIFSFFCDTSMIEGMKKQGINPDDLIDMYIQVHNKCLASRPHDLAVGIHLCRGNFRHSIHFAEGGYDAIAERLFNEINVDSYYLEYDTERAGTFEPLKYLPKHKSVVLGIVTTKSAELEDMGLLRERVFEAAQFMASGTGESADEALQRISVSPQCGFASHEDGNLLTANDMKLKLQLVRDLAISIWADA